MCFEIVLLLHLCNFLIPDNNIASGVGHGNSTMCDGGIVLNEKAINNFSPVMKKSKLFLVGKIAEKAVCRSVFYNMAQYFDCRINKNALLQTFFFADFTHWVMCSIYS